MSKRNVILKSFYVNDGFYNLFTRAKGTSVRIRSGNSSEVREYIQGRDEVIVEWGACPEWGQHCAAETWADTPANRKKAYAYMAQSIRDWGWNRK
jgi:hypothetical protein